MNPKRTIRVLCVDDNAEARSVFTLLMKDNPAFEALTPLGRVSDLLQCIAVMKPDVVVLDLWMPGQDAIDAMREAKARYPDAQFLILSSDDDPTQVQRAFINGATGFAVKDGSFERLTNAIRKVALGEPVTPDGGARNTK